MRGRRLSRPSRAAFAALVAGAILSAFNLGDWHRRLFEPPFGNDFRLYYAAARIGLDQGWNRIYDLDAQRRAVEALGSGFYWSPFLNPPPMAWLAAPFAFLPYWAALVLWTLVLGAALAGAWYLAAPGDPWSRAAHLVGALALFPVAFGLLIGQVPALVALAVAACWWLLKHDRPALAGLALSALALKPQTALLVPLALVAAGRLRAAGWCAGALLVLSGLSVLSLGGDGTAAYRSALEVASQWELTRRYAFSGVIGTGPLLAVTQLIVVLLVAWTGRRHRFSGPELPIAAGLCGSLLFTRYIGIQDLTVVLVGAWLVLRAPVSTWTRALVMAGFIPAEMALVWGPLPLLAWEAAWLLSLAFWPGPQPSQPRIRTQALPAQTSR